MILLMTLSLTACGHLSKIERIEPFRCNEPQIKGNTWADVAVLAIEQRDALRECNLRNGFPPEDEE